MDLQQLKSVWVSYDEKMAANRKLSELVVLSMIRDKSRGVLAGMQREILRACLLCVVLIVFFSASVLANAFDFTQPIQYVPILFYIALASMALFLLLKERSRLGSVNLTKDTLHEALKKVIHAREKFQAVIRKVWFLIPLTSLAFLISLVAKTVETYGVLKFSSIVGALIGGSILFVLVARRHVHLFKDAYCEDLKESLQELEELQNIK